MRKLNPRERHVLVGTGENGYGSHAMLEATASGVEFYVPITPEELRARFVDQPNLARAAEAFIATGEALPEKIAAVHPATL